MQQFCFLNLDPCNHITITHAAAIGQRRKRRWVDADSPAQAHDVLRVDLTSRNAIVPARIVELTAAPAGELGQVQMPTSSRALRADEVRPSMRGNLNWLTVQHDRLARLAPAHGYANSVLDDAFGWEWLLLMTAAQDPTEHD